MESVSMTDSSHQLSVRMLFFVPIHHFFDAVDRLHPTPDFLKGCHHTVLQRQDGLNVQQGTNKGGCHTDPSVFLQVFQRIHHEVDLHVIDHPLNCSQNAIHIFPCQHCLRSD